MNAEAGNGRVPVSVVLPVRNGVDRIDACLAAIRQNHPAQVILVDGNSTDGTRERARGLVDRIVIDTGMGPGAARQLGAEAASSEWIAFIDVDVDLPPAALSALLAEAMERQLQGLQAGLRSVGEGDFWSDELAWHHNQGRSRSWFGVSASLLARNVVLREPFDHRFRSGEDIDLRLRLEQRRVPVGVSRSTTVTHHFFAGFPFAWKQFVDDGAGIGRLVRKFGRASVRHAFVPFAAAAAGMLRGWRHPLRHGRYFVTFACGNFLGLTRGLLDPAIEIRSLGRVLLVTGVLFMLWMPVVVGGVVGAAVVLRLVDVVAGPTAALALSVVSLGIVALAIGASVALEAARAVARPGATAPRPATPALSRRIMNRAARGVTILAGAALVLGVARLVMILYA